MLAQIKRGPKGISTKSANNSSGNSIKNILSDIPQTIVKTTGPRLSCEMQNGMPIVQGGGNSCYYLFSQDGQRLLIVTRKKNQSLVVGNDIDIVVLDIDGDEVKLGITCPGDTSIRCIQNR